MSRLTRKPKQQPQMMLPVVEWLGLLLRFLPTRRSLAQVLAVVVCLSVCLSLSHAGIVSKRLNVGSCKQRHVITQGL